MRAAAYVEEAAKMSRDLVNRESRGAGDTDNAMRRVERKWGVPYSLLWGLRYRRPKDITVGNWLSVRQAWEAQREEQIKRFEHERAITQAKGWLSTALVSAADALAGAQDK